MGFLMQETDARFWYKVPERISPLLYAKSLTAYWRLLVHYLTGNSGLCHFWHFCHARQLSTKQSNWNCCWHGSLHSKLCLHQV